MKNEMQNRFNAISKEYDSQRKQLIPCFDEFYETIIDLLPEGNNSPKVLDIGAGTGLLSALILEKFPNAEITLIDISEGILEKAKNRFDGARFNYITADYSTYQFEDNFDFVVSALSIHHLANEKKEKLYKTVNTILNPGGLFINADQFLGSTKENEFINQEWWNKSVASTSLDTGSIAAWKERTAMDIPATIKDNLNWLLSAEFENVDIFFKQYNFGVIYGQKK